MIQHGREASPAHAAGQLLGMDDMEAIDVTDAFPFALNVQDDIEQEDYHAEMLKALRDVNVDNNTVGWYQACNVDTVFNQTLIDTQFIYQENYPNAVIIICDPFRSSNGSTLLKAFRLSNAFMELYREKKGASFSHIRSGNVLEEVPVEVVFTSLEQLLMTQIRSHLQSCGSVRTTEESDILTKRVIDSFTTSLDEYLLEYGRIQHQLRSNLKQQISQNQKAVLSIFFRQD